MKTSDYIAIKYFDVLFKKLAEITKYVNEDCPLEYRTEHLKAALESSIDLVDEIDHEQMIDNGQTTKSGHKSDVSL